MRSSSLGVLGAAALLLAVGCGDSKGSEVNPGSGAAGNAGGSATGSGADGSGADGSGAETGKDMQNGSGADGSGASGTGGSGLIIDVGSGGDDGSDRTGGGNGKPELCDGIDNDENGIIDDVDAGHDGVCDCLNIATIGHIGPWSNGGNVFASWLNARSPLGAVALEDQELTADTLKKFQIVVVLHAATMGVESNGVSAPALHDFSEAEATAFDTWVRGGGGVMTTIGYSGDEANEVVNVNKLLAKLGMGYSATNLDLNGNVTSWETHPVTDGISNIFTNNGVEPDGPQGMTIAHGEGDRVALQVTQADDGRVAVWGDEWITYDSEWADTKGQQVEHFWLNLLKWLSPPHECQVPIPTRVK